MGPSTTPSKIKSCYPTDLRIKNYIIDEQLGKGRFGVVKSGRHIITGQTVAIKILRRKDIKDCEIVEKVRREIRLLKHLHHPHIIKLYQAINTPTDIFMVMEYISGGELFEHIMKSGKINEFESRRFFQQIISGVSYCHSHRIIHRDLKPENLLLDSNCDVKIADFGLCNIMKDGELMKTSCGSPNYAAPEIVSGLLYVGPEVDIWSCGIILYALLTGRLPFDDQSITNLFKKIKAGTFIFPSNTPDGPKRLITGMLDIDPQKRLKIQQIIEDEWFKKDLPSYLFIDHDEVNEKLDDRIIKMVAEKFKMSPQSVVQSLSKGFQSDSLLATYRIMQDNYNRELRYDNPCDSLHLLSTEAPSFRRHSDTEDISINESFRKNQNRWSIGIRARGDAVSIINQVYTRLALLDYEWRTLHPFKIELRKKRQDGAYVYIAANLYKHDENRFLLDFHVISADEGTNAPPIEDYRYDKPTQLHANENQKASFTAVEFLRLCGDLIIELSR